MNKVEFAKKIAALAHDGQKYGERPYMWHLEDVAKEVLRGNTFVATDYATALVVTAYLHDILEDTSVTYDTLVIFFGKDVADAVKALTRKKGQYYADYMEQVMANPIASRVKLADSLCNLRQSVIERSHKRIRKYSNNVLMLQKHIGETDE